MARKSERTKTTNATPPPTNAPTTAAAAAKSAADARPSDDEVLDAVLGPVDGSVDGDTINAAPSPAKPTTTAAPAPPAAEAPKAAGFLHAPNHRRTPRETPPSGAGESAESETLRPRALSASERAQLTPAMRQYFDVRDQYAYPEYTLLFQMGDFYEVFFEDAKRVAHDLAIALTKRGKVGDVDVPLCGFPLKSLGMHTQKLLAKGHKVVVVEQVQDPRDAKGVVERDITRIITPGTVTDDEWLDSGRENFIVAIAPSRKVPPGEPTAVVGMAWAELSTGRFELAVVTRAEAGRELARLEPAETVWPEYVFAEGVEPDPLLDAIGRLEPAPIVTVRPTVGFDVRESRRRLAEHFRVDSLRGFGCDEAEADAGVAAAGALMLYLRETQRQSLGHIVTLRRVTTGQRMILDQATRRCLELTETLRNRERRGSLIGVIDRTLTPMGSRTLRDWLTSPLTEMAPIEARHAAVAELLENNDLRRQLGDILRGTGDLERLASRVGYGRANGRDLAAIRDALTRLPMLRGALAECDTELLRRVCEFDALESLHAELAAMLVALPPLTIKDGGLIRDGANAELDELRQLATDGAVWMQKFAEREIKATGIPTLKVDYNSVFGYYIEVTRAQKDKVPSRYERKQTLKNAERFITPELKAQEQKILSAGERSRDLEYDLFLQLREKVSVNVPALLDTAKRIAVADVLLSLAQLAETRGYTRPELLDEPIIEITDGRHPVIEAMPSREAFVPNDCVLADGRIALVITGPNMAGKSTYIRQVALIALLAQIGSYVPAQRARIGIVDRIFTRLGSADELARGQSTFMVEMTETANILNHATKQSLVILDEVGRGTSTFDGVAIAWAAMEHLLDHIGCRTLFATHYHELTELQNLYPQVGNVRVDVREWEDEIIFLHRISDGGADKSYGIHVARLAGLPRPVIERAKALLVNLEAQQLDVHGRPKFVPKPTLQKKQVQLTLFVPAGDRVYEELQQLDVNSLTPIQALAILERLAKIARDLPTPE